MDDQTNAPSVGDVHALRCADCAASDSAAYDAVPVDYMPIPAEAIAGFPDGVPKLGRHNRRRFLQNGVVGVASVYAATKIPWQTAFESAVAEGAVGPNNCLVLIFLNGGNDGSNTFVPTDPTQYAEYLRLRPTIGRTTTVGLTNTGGQLGFPAIPGMTGAGLTLQTMWEANNVALFPATDYPNPNLSHFTSRDWWFAGALQKSTTGWLGRWLDAYGSQTNPLQAVSIGSNVSKIIRAARAPVASVPESLGAGFGFTVGASVNGEVGSLAAEPASNAATSRSRLVYGQTVQVANNLGTVGAVSTAGYPANSSLSRRLQAAATLIASGLGTRVVTIDWGSFDTHGGQIAAQDPQLTVLGQALAAFQADLVARGVEGRVATCVFSEFGRRGGENASSGTDHGAGGTMMVLGSAVRGGLGGEVAPMTALDRGNLRVMTDFRSVYGALLSEWMGGDPGAILPGGPFPLTRPAGGSLML